MASNIVVNVREKLLPRLQWQLESKHHRNMDGFINGAAILSNPCCAMLTIKQFNLCIHRETGHPDISVSELFEFNIRVAVTYKRRNNEWFLILVCFNEILIKLFRPGGVQFSLRSIKGVAVVIAGEDSR